MSNITITHNDVTVVIPDDCNVWKFLTIRNVKHPKYIVFELDGEMVPQDKWYDVIIVDGAEIESDYLAGGG